ncbi:MAG: PilX N-terminal domain-containing pilus assembly protein [Halopseudomonas sp.]
MIHQQHYRNQQGATLIIALVFMVMLTVISLSSMHSSSFEIKVARSVKSGVDALASAEDSLQAGEDEVCNRQQAPSSCNGGFYDSFDDDGYYVGNQISLADLSTYLSLNAASSTAAVSGTTTNQTFAIEYLGIINPSGSTINVGQAGADSRYLFRVTGYGQSAKGGAKLTQSYFTTMD